MKTLRWAPLAFFALFLLSVGETSGDEVPPAVKEILKQFEDEKSAIQKKADVVIKEAQGKADEQIGLSKQKVVTQLMVLQDKYCKEGKLDQALAVRDQIRLLRSQMTNGGVKPDPGYFSPPLTDIGKVFYFRVKGKKTGSIYGTDVYTTGSDVGTCAVHTGVLKDGEEGIVKVNVLPGQASYARTTRHGVTSHAYGQYSISISVEALPVANALNPKDTVRPDPGTLHAFRGMNGISLLFEVTGSTNGKVWGADVYTDDSTLAKAAVHAGVLSDGEKGVVKVTILAGQSRYKGMERNKVTSDSWGGWVGSFKVEASKIAVGAKKEKKDK